MPSETKAAVPVLDHVVINVLGKLDEAASQYQRLGFMLTPRGHHTLGSSNNLAIFGDDYLELLGYQPGREAQRQDLWQHPPGLSGLVFKAVDPNLVYTTMSARGVPVGEPMQFARPVELHDGSHDARFAVVQVKGDAVKNGRTFFCHHFTPELVWRPEWQTHANGVTRLTEFVIAARDPAQTASIYERMFGPGLLTRVPGGISFGAGSPVVLILDPATIAARYGGAALTSADGSDRMVGLSFKVSSLDKAKSALGVGEVPFGPFAGGGIIVPSTQAANVALAFVE